MAMDPILNSKNPSAVQIQNFDFVYIPRHVVEAHLPSFNPRQVRLKAERIAKELKIENKVPLNCMKNQVQLVDWYNKHQINLKDPNGTKRLAIKTELDRLNMQLSVLIPVRRNLITDIGRLQQSIKVICVPPGVNVRLNDAQYRDCMAMRGQEMFLSNEFARLNLKETEILKRQKNIRKELLII